MTTLLAVLVALTAQVSADPDSINVAVVVEPDSVTIGDRFTLTVSISGAGNAQVSFPTLPDTGGVTALGPPLVGLDEPGGAQDAIYQLAAWEVGELALPAADIVIVTDSSEIRVPLPETAINVLSVLPAESDPDTLALKPAWDVLGGNWSLAEKVSGGALALGLILALALYLRHRNAAAQIVVQPPPKPPLERALEALDRLAGAGLIEVGEYKAFYSALAQILREFVSESYHGLGLDLTSAELIAAARLEGVDDWSVEGLRQLLNEADLVKFARRSTPMGRAAQALEAARRWVKEFAPPVVEEPEVKDLAEEKPVEEATEGYGEILDETAELEAIFASDDEFEAEVDGDDMYSSSDAAESSEESK